MKIVLLYPEVLDLARFKEKRKEFPPFGVMYLAAIAEQAGYVVDILPISMEVRSLDLTEYDVVGFSISSSATYNIVKVVRNGSKYKDSVTIMVGGVHATIYSLLTFQDLHPDVLCVGDGEHCFIEILSILPTNDFTHVEGIYCLNRGLPFYTGERKFEKTLDWLPLPARHLLPQESFIMTDRLSDTDLRMAHVMFSRGCPFSCTYCSAAHTKVQYRSGVHARKELMHLVEKYNIEGFAVTDDNFVIARKKVLDVVYQISDLSLRWSALSRVDTVDESLLKEMFSAGCIEIKFGVESGSEKMLQIMRKNITRDQISAAVMTAFNVGIKVKVFIVHGHPGENMETTIETMLLLEKLKKYIQRVSLFRFVPLPGSYVFEHADEFSVLNTKTDPNWDGDWSKYHIYHNNYHWWGSMRDFQEVERSFNFLKSFVETEWPDTF